MNEKEKEIAKFQVECESEAALDEQLSSSIERIRCNNTDLTKDEIFKIWVKELREDHAKHAEAGTDDASLLKNLVFRSFDRLAAS